VILHEPFLPMEPPFSPGFIIKDTLSKMIWLPYVFVRLLTESIEKRI